MRLTSNMVFMVRGRTLERVVQFIFHYIRLLQQDGQQDDGWGRLYGHRSCPHLGTLTLTLERLSSLREVREAVLLTC